MAMDQATCFPRASAFNHLPNHEAKQTTTFPGERKGKEEYSMSPVLLSVDFDKVS